MTACATTTDIASGATSTGAQDHACRADVGAPPRISVVIPTYNSRAIVRDAIHSVLAQTLAPLEVIVVDDGSTDGTAESLAGLDPRVRCLRQANAGPARARTVGASNARGDWIALLDADDVWLADKLERQWAAASKVGADAVFCSLIWPTPRGEIIEGYAGSTLREHLLPAMLKRNALAGGCSSMLIRRETFERLGGFDKTYEPCEDRDLFIRIADACRVAYVREPLVRRRVGPVQFGGNPVANHRANELLLQRHAPRIAGWRGERVALREARARIHQRAGLHYLNLGRRREAFGEMFRAVRLWPFLADPWRAMLNALCGRLPPVAPVAARESSA